MEHFGTVRLETERLILRRFTVEDAESMYNNWASDDEVTRFLTWPTHSDVSVSRSLLNDWVAEYSQNSRYNWAIVLKESGDEPIGAISVVYHYDDIEAVGVGYCLGRKWWRQGIASEALKCVIDFLFAKVGAQRIEASHDTKNPNSGAVMRKCGMKYEGTLRKARRNNQGIRDICYYSILSEEWDGVKRCKLL